MSTIYVQYPRIPTIEIRYPIGRSDLLQSARLYQLLCLGRACLNSAFEGHGKAKRIIRLGRTISTSNAK